MKTRRQRTILATMMTLVMIIGCLVIPTSSSTAEAASKKLKVTCSQKTVTVGSSIKIKTNVKATFKSSNKKIATVSSKGVVKGKKAGKVKITVTSKQNKKQKKTVKITVKKKPKTVETSTTTETPNTTAPTIEQPTTETVVTPNPGPTTEAPTVEQPTTEQPATTEEPTKEQPSTQEPTIIGIEAKYRGDKVPNDLTRITKCGIDLKFVYSNGNKEDIILNENNYTNLTYTIINEESIGEDNYVIYKVCYQNYETEMRIQVVDVDKSIVYAYQVSLEYTGGTIKNGEDPNLDDISATLIYTDMSTEKLDSSKLRLIKHRDYGEEYEYIMPYDYTFTDNNGNELYICIFNMYVGVPHD